MSLNLGMYNLNMFGGTGFNGLTSFGGFGNFGSFGMGGSLFTNCFGEVNYDAMAGYGVANALLGVASQAINQTVGNKRAAKAEHENNKAEIEKINQEIADLMSINPEDKIDSSYDTNIKTAQQNKDDVGRDIENAKELIDTYNTDLGKEGLTEGEKTTIRQKIQQQNEVINKKQPEFNKLNGDANTEGSVKYYEAKKEEAIKAKKAEIEQKIQELETKKAQLQESVNDVVLDNADGSKWKRTTKENFDKKWNQDGTAAENTEFTKSDLRYVIAGFRSATTPEEKREWAKKFETIYENLSVSDRSNDFIAAKKIIDNYAG